MSNKYFNITTMYHTNNIVMNETNNPVHIMRLPRLHGGIYQ